MFREPDSLLCRSSKKCRTSWNSCVSKRLGQNYKLKAQTGKLGGYRPRCWQPPVQVTQCISESTHICSPDGQTGGFRTLSGWDDTVRGLAQDLSEQLGVVHTACVEASLQKVSLVQEQVSFDFDTNADTPPGTFATMVLLQLSPDTVCALQ